MEAEIDGLVLVGVQSEGDGLEVGTLDHGLGHQGLGHCLWGRCCAILHLKLLLIVLISS